MSRADDIAALTLPLDQLPDPLPIPVIEKPFDVTIRPPGSKSITNRALLLAALADGTSELRGPLIDADDAQVMLRAIQQLGAKVEIQRARSASEGLDVVRITGVNGRWKIAPGETITLNLHNAGTATRFLTAAAILAPPDSGGIIIDGDARMRERPIGELTEALTQLGVRVTFLNREGYPPVHVHPAILMQPDPTVTFGRTASSQFISAMALTACFLPRGLKIVLTHEITSPWYISMTTYLLQQVGVPITGLPYIHRDHHSRDAIQTSHHSVKAFTLNIEPDLSGATYWYGAAAMQHSSSMLVEGALPEVGAVDESEPHSLQPDAAFPQVMSAFGAVIDLRAEGTSCRANMLKGVDADLSNMPDTAMTAAAIACFASPTPENPTATTTLRGLRTLRVKETDRLAALQTELSKLGAHVEIFKDGDDEGLRITPPPPSDPSCLRGSVASCLPIHFDTYNDHRMAMALALIGLRRPNVFIRNPACVAKTYPTFWQDLARLYA